jgi:hypothetical protein
MHNTCKNPTKIIQNIWEAAFCMPGGGETIKISTPKTYFICTYKYKFIYIHKFKNINEYINVNFSVCININVPFSLTKRSAEAPIFRFVAPITDLQAGMACFKRPVHNYIVYKWIWKHIGSLLDRTRHTACIPWWWNHVYSYVCMHIWIFIYMYTYLFIYILIYKKRIY